MSDLAILPISEIEYGPQEEHNVISKSSLCITNNFPAFTALLSFGQSSKKYAKGRSRR